MRFFRYIRGKIRRALRKMKRHEHPALEDGLAIFQELSDIYGEKLEDIAIAEKCFKDLLKETGGAVIVDFLDTDNWDCIRDVEFDKEAGVVRIIWQVPLKDPMGEQMRRMVFSTDYFLMAIKFRNLQLIADLKHHCFAMVMNGYTWQKSDYKKFIVNDGWKASNPDETSSFFSTDYIRLKDNKTEFIRLLKTPISSFWIIPKNLHLSHDQSNILLYQYNVSRISESLDKALSKLEKVLKQKLTKEDEKDEIKTVGNKMRRQAESLFKLMLCYYHKRYGFKAEDYNSTQRLLGVLISDLKKTIYKTEEDKQRFKDIVIIANDLSHDSGNPANAMDAARLYAMLKYYIEDFKYNIAHHDSWQPEVDLNTKPSPSEYIKNEYLNFDFSNEISTCIHALSGKISYRIEIDPGKGFSFFDLEDKEFLCKDGKIRKLDASSFSEALVVWNRDECKHLLESMYHYVEQKCDAQQLSSESVGVYITFEAVLKREGKPTHLFTEQEIKQLMENANDEDNNKLVIDEEGIAHIIQDTNDGVLYPVSQETWCSGNRYVGKDSSLSDLRPSYILSLHSWLRYLKNGCHVYDDQWIADDNVDEIIEEIKQYM